MLAATTTECPDLAARLGYVGSSVDEVALGAATFTADWLKKPLVFMKKTGSVVIAVNLGPAVAIATGEAYEALGEFVAARQIEQRLLALQMTIAQFR
jgi:hypothetical protein